MARPARRLVVGDIIQFGEQGRVCFGGEFAARVADMKPGGEVELVFSLDGPVLDEALAAVGDMPLPPYIARRRPAGEVDRQAYQTIYAREDGAGCCADSWLSFD